MLDAREVDALHHSWCLPYELVDLAPHQEEPSWAVALDDGNLLRPHGPYAPAVVARVQGHEHVLATEAWAQDAAREFLAQQTTDDAGWLLRIGRSGAAEHELRIWSGPDPVSARPARDHGVALLMDFGKVLCHFDYGWFVWGHSAVFGHEPSPEALLAIEAARPAFEAGDLGEDAFFQLCAEQLGLLEADRRLFDAAWANILRLHDDMTGLLRRALEQPGWEAVIVSNIDPILVRETVARFGLDDIFRDGVFSYEADLRPKHEDSSMWRCAIERVGARLGETPQLIVATDDTPANLLTAAGEAQIDGTILFHRPWQWQFELGRHGAYLPRARASVPAAT